MKLILLLSLFISVTFAQFPQFDYSSYGSLLIQNEGRYKPLDSYARHMLLEYSGKSTIKIEGEKYSALDWMNMVIFNHPLASSTQCFLINNPQVVDAYGVKRNPHRTYSYTDLLPAQQRITELAQAVMQVDSKKRSDVEREFLRVYSLFQKLQEHSAAFTFAQKHETFRVKTQETAKLLALDTGLYSYLEIREKADTLSRLIESISKKPVENWTTSDSTLSLFSYALYEWTEFYKGNQFGVIPALLDKEYWLSPWAIIGHRLTDRKELLSALEQWTALAQSFNGGDAAGFTEAAQKALSAERGRYPELRYSAIDLEVTYNSWEFFYKAKILFGFGLLLALLALVAKPKVCNRISFWLLLSGTVLGVIGIGFRMYISQRPPVTNLFETFIFTGTVTALIGILVEKYQKNGNGNLIGTLTALMLFLISGKYSSQGDTMGVLVAVLDSNFWLATHVIAISLGYAGCVAAGVMGHVYLMQRLFGKSKEDLTKTYKTLFGILGFGLTLSFIGTVLGGIWADQSWGRFWGWDPKENGALLIVLWSAIIFHMRIAGWVKELGVAIASVIGIIMVMLAWFGINLLGVGLHSYGFTTGIAFNLILYISLQVVFLLVVVPLIIRRERKA
ncbi:MAG: cytochrome c biogenesis protein CcsA [Fibrobacterales bacterium]